MRLNVVDISFISYHQSDHLATAVQRVQAVDAQVRLLVCASAGCKCDLYQKSHVPAQLSTFRSFDYKLSTLSYEKIRANDVSICAFAKRQTQVKQSQREANC